MTSLSLEKFLRKQGELSQILSALFSENGNGMCILDAKGSPLIGSMCGAELSRHPVVYEGETIGWVAGHAQAASAAALLELILNQEGEKKSLAGELIGGYRE